MFTRTGFLFISILSQSLRCLVAVLWSNFLCFAAFAPMNYGGDGFVRDDLPSRNQPLDAQRYFSEADSSD